MERDEEQWMGSIDKLCGRQATDISDDEINSFMQRIDKVECILSKLRSEDAETVKLGMCQADEMLGAGELKEVNEDQLKIIKDRTVVNTKPEEPQEPTGMECFMRSVEVDAARRAEDRRQRKEAAERFKTQGNKAFRSGDYVKALNSYNKAIEEVKDSCLLYTNRALTQLRLGLPEAALQDCEKALQLNESSLKASLYKAQALYLQGDPDQASQTTQSVLLAHPQHKTFILDYAKDWFQETNNLN